MLAVHGLLGDAEAHCDVLPGPPGRPGVLNLQDLELLGQSPQRGHRPQPDLGIVAADVLRKLSCHRHVRQHALTYMICQHMLTKHENDVRRAAPHRRGAILPGKRPACPVPAARPRCSPAAVPGLRVKLSPVHPAEVGEGVAELLVPGEQIQQAFKAMRDYVVFTDKRLIAVNVQGITDKKKDFTSLPYSKVQAFSVETAGTLDLDAELDLWFSGLGKLRLEFKGRADIRRLGQLIAGYVL